jgi:hypothetical protein
MALQLIHGFDGRIALGKSASQASEVSAAASPSWPTRRSYASGSTTEDHYQDYQSPLPDAGRLKRVGSPSAAVAQLLVGAEWRSPVELS